MNVEIVVPNLAALRAAVFTLSGKTLRVGGGYPPPPVGARVNLRRAGGLDFPWIAGGRVLHGCTFSWPPRPTAVVP